MVVYIMTNAPEGLRGELTKWLLEVKAGVFIGNINKTVREKLWNKIEFSDIQDALMIYNSNTEQGFDIEMLGEPNRYLIDYEGILLIGRKIENQD